MTIELSGHLPIGSAHETAHDSTDEPGVVPVGQIILSTGFMAADRRTNDDSD